MSYKIKVIWLDGTEEFVQEGQLPGRDAVFSSWKKADATADFLRQGICVDEAQSISVVKVSRRYRSLINRCNQPVKVQR